MIWIIIILLGFVAVLLGIIIFLTNLIKQWKQVAVNRLNLLRRIIDLMFVHKGQPLVFLKKAHNEIYFRNLLNAKIIPWNKSYRNLSKNEEAECFLCELIKNGFSRKEVCEIFELKNVGCLYVKFHRAKRKLQKMGVDFISES